MTYLFCRTCVVSERNSVEFKPSIRLLGLDVESILLNVIDILEVIKFGLDVLPGFNIEAYTSIPLSAIIPVCVCVIVMNRALTILVQKSFFCTYPFGQAYTHDPFLVTSST